LRIVRTANLEQIAFFLWVKKSCFFLPYQGNGFSHCENSAAILISAEHCISWHRFNWLLVSQDELQDAQAP
jgi:hypothetical protein